MRFFGAMLTVAVLVPVTAFSQSSPAQTVMTLDGHAVMMGAVATDVENSAVPQEFALLQNYPNPFNPSTLIRYSLEKPVRVSLKVYNMLGNAVATLVDGPQEAGSYSITLNSNDGTLNIASGVYFYRLEAGSFVSTKKLILIK
jgi:hypothetical protein